VLRNAPASRGICRALDGAFARPSTLLIAHVAQTLAHRVEIIEPGVINLEMVTAQDGLMLIVTEIPRSNLQDMNMVFWDVFLLRPFVGDLHPE
jgi:hypothetical protein